VLPALRALLPARSRVLRSSSPTRAASCSTAPSACSASQTFEVSASPGSKFALTVEGNLRSLNELARDAKADYIIHTGDFGFYDHSSLDRIAEK
jgi:hypothetical protein